jgi:hypothetical protein
MEIPRILVPSCDAYLIGTHDRRRFAYLAQLDTGADHTASFLHVVIGVDPFDVPVTTESIVSP